jgi:Flp pilus assembly pilin Flp
VSLLRRLLRDSRGASLVEFALIAPILIVSILAIFDLGYNMYATAMLQGSIQRAARNATIEGADTRSTLIDLKVAEAVHDVVHDAELEFERRAYATFSEVGQPEDFTDVDLDGQCNNGEPFEDANGNGTHDSDRGTAGQGGARDAVLYSVTVTYPRAFPMASLLGQPETWSTVATTVLRNQPFGLQESASTTGNCT